MRELVEWLGAGTDIHPVLSMADPRAWGWGGARSRDGDDGACWLKTG
jgi:hypothetical protein